MFEGPLQDLIDEFSRLPGIGPKSAQRIAFHVLHMEPEDIERLVARYGYSRYPTTDEAGELMGYLHLKDVLYADETERAEIVKRDTGGLDAEIAALNAERVAYLRELSEDLEPKLDRMLADDAQLLPRTAEALTTAWRGAVARAGSASAGIQALRGLRRQELLRIACADLLGLLDVVAVGGALHAVAVATLLLEQARALCHKAAYVVDSEGNNVHQLAPLVWKEKIAKERLLEGA